VQHGSRQPAMQRKLILFELNEVPFRVIDDFCRDHPASALARCLPRCSQYETVTEDAVLSPWVTWPTIHRGVTDALHGIGHFGQDLGKVDAKYPPVWRMLSEHGVTTGVFASLHTSPMPGDVRRYTYYVPDPFAATADCYPEDLAVFQLFNLTMSRESMRNVSNRLPVGWALRLLKSTPGLGIRVGTLADVARQLVEERFVPWKHVRRRTYQTVLAFDVFMKQLNSTLPRFTTFFTNHVASSMHRYWAATYPGDYETLEYKPDWVHRYKSEIDFAMGKFDEELARLTSFVDTHPEYTLWVASSMGQAAHKGQPLRSQVLVKDVARLMSVLGAPKGTWEERPAMAPTISVYVADTHLQSFRESIAAARVADRPVPQEEQGKGFFSISMGQANVPLDGEFIVIRGERVSFRDAGLENIVIEDEAGSSAYHVRTGSLLVYDPLAKAANPARGRLKTTELAPTILERFGVKPAGYMSAPAQIGA
jgi:hypothetical protein